MYAAFWNTSHQYSIDQHSQAKYRFTLCNLNKDHQILIIRILLTQLYGHQMTIQVLTSPNVVGGKMSVSFRAD